MGETMEGARGGNCGAPVRGFHYGRQERQTADPKYTTSTQTVSFFLESLHNMNNLSISQIGIEMRSYRAMDVHV